MDEIELESPKASPAETLRAYSFFYRENTVLFEAVVFCIGQLLLAAAFWFGKDFTERVIPSAGFAMASCYLPGVLICNSKRRRLRLSVWEAEIKEFCVKPRAIAFATIAPIVALVTWLTILFLECSL